jgi:hypothetical protein
MDQTTLVMAISFNAMMACIVSLAVSQVYVRIMVA